MSEQESKPLQTRVESGKVYLSNIPQEERKQAPTRREILGSKFRTTERGLEESRHKERLVGFKRFRERRSQIGREKEERQIQRELEEARRLRQKRFAREELQAARRASKERVTSERRKKHPRLSGFFSSKPQRKSKTAKPYHHGQHKNDIQCNIYRKKLRLQRKRRALLRSANR